MLLPLMVAGHYHSEYANLADAAASSGVFPVQMTRFDGSKQEDQSGSGEVVHQDRDGGYQPM